MFEQYGHERPFTPNFFVNQYAAMPSMHFGWNMLVGLALWLSTKNVFVRASGGHHAARHVHGHHPDRQPLPP